MAKEKDKTIAKLQEALRKRTSVGRVSGTSTGPAPDVIEDLWRKATAREDSN